MARTSPREPLAKGGVITLWMPRPRLAQSLQELGPFLRSILEPGRPPFILIDMAGIFPESPQGVSQLLERRFLPQDPAASAHSGDAYLSRLIQKHAWEGRELSLIPLSRGPGLMRWNTALESAASQDLVALRHLLYNLQVAHEAHPWVLLLLPSDWSPWHAQVLGYASLAWVWPEQSSSAAEAAASAVQGQAGVEHWPLFWCGPWAPLRTAGARLQRAASACRSCLVPDGEVPAQGSALLQAVTEALRRRIRLRNPPPTGVRFLLHTWWLWALALAALFLVPPLGLDSPVVELVSYRQEMQRHGMPAHIQFRFDGKETLQRISKYAIGKYTAAVPTLPEIQQYMEEVRLANGELRPWKVAKDGAIYPPSSRILRFPPPHKLRNPLQDSLAPAWSFFTGILSDSISYLTEYYNLDARKGRVHDGIDVGSRMGARILAPFSGKAWTAADGRAGVIIGLVQGDDVLLFMHCDQLLYLDGQEVMQGDPLATVGLTGHTTGPHAHIGAGRIHPKGRRRVGPLRYDSMDPVEWYYQRQRRLGNGS